MTACADPTAVKDRVKAHGHLKSLAAAKINELVDQNVLIEQGSGDLVFMNSDFENIVLVDERYDQLKK
jgi:hypothetical protein